MKACHAVAFLARGLFFAGAFLAMHLWPMKSHTFPVDAATHLWMWDRLRSMSYGKQICTILPHVKV